MSTCPVAGNPACICKCARHIGLLVFRIGLGGMILAHGYPKLLALFGGEGSQWMNPIGIGSTLSLSLCVFAEFVCSIAVMLGFLTRPAALVLAINFCIIACTYRAGTSAEMNELVLVYLLSFVTLMLTGPGRLSLDRMLFRRCLHRKCCRG